MSSKICIKCPHTTKCYSCKTTGCQRCITTVCCDCSVRMCYECKYRSDHECGCYGNCAICDSKVNRGEHGWPCYKCDIWLCDKCQPDNKCNCDE